jgi:ParB family chromosome partitioning protein
MNRRREQKPYQIQGVNALFGETPETEPEQPRSIPLALIQTSSYQPRHYFDAHKQAQLTESIKQFGILEPLLVRPLPNGRYELVAGERRYLAAIEAQLVEVPIISKNLSDQEALTIALLENLQREDLNPIEETEGILQLLILKTGLAKQELISLFQRMKNDVKRGTDHVIRQDDAQQIIKFFADLSLMTWESFATNRMPLLKLPDDILSALQQGEIEYTKAKAIATLPDQVQRQNLLQEAKEQNLSLNQIREKIAFLKTSSEVSHPKKQLKSVYQELNQAKLWDKNPPAWKKVQSWLLKIETILAEQQENVITEQTQTGQDVTPNS